MRWRSLSRAPALAWALVWAIGLATGASSGQDDRTVLVFDQQVMHWDQQRPLLEHQDGCVIKFARQAHRKTVELPASVAPARTPRVIATVTIEPIIGPEETGSRPNDLWTRLGWISLITSGADGSRQEIEIVRFVTGYGATGTFEQDVTELAPLLAGKQSFEAYLSTFSQDPGWRLSFSLTYTDRGAGYRRPKLAKRLFNDPHIIAPEGRPGHLQTSVTIPTGLARPRLRITSTGHSTDGAGANEFVTSTHVLRIDGREIARWRPWSERGPQLRDRNPFAGRARYGPREVWASDLDRSGWQPGTVVQPMLIPTPELTPGPHRIEILIYGIRAPIDSEEDEHGYWALSATIVADEPLAAQE